MAALSSATRDYDSLNRNYIQENYAKYALSDELDPIGMERNIQEHLCTIFNEIQPGDQKEVFDSENTPFSYLDKTFYASLFTQTVLYINSIDTCKYGDILMMFFSDRDELLNNILENVKETMIVDGVRSVHCLVYDFLRVLFAYNMDIFESFCTKYFNYCLLKNDPLAIFEFPLLKADVWSCKGYFEKVINISLVKFVSKTEHFKRKIVNYFGEDVNQAKETFRSHVAFSERLNFIVSNTTDTTIYELFFTTLFEKVILLPFIDNLVSERFYKTVSHIHDNYLNNILTEDSEQGFSKVVDLFNFLAKYKLRIKETNQTCLKTIEELFDKKIDLLLKCWINKYHKLDYGIEKVTLVCLKKSHIDHDISGNGLNSTLESMPQNMLIYNLLAKELSLDLEAVDESERFIKKYSFSNLIFSSKMTNIVIDSPFPNPFKIDNEIPTNLNLHIHFHEYILLLCFQDSEILLFKVMKARFYRILDLCYPLKNHSDNTSQELFKTSFKKFYQNRFMIALVDEKKLKWNAFLSAWRRCFENNDYRNFKVRLLLDSSPKLNKINYIFDESLHEYVYKL